MPPQSAIWTPDPHTLAKHDLLKRYLGAWFPIMARNNRKLVFLDGFAGPGVYDTGEPGSPLVALRSLVEHRYFDEMKATTFLFLSSKLTRGESSRLRRRSRSTGTRSAGSQPTSAAASSRASSARSRATSPAT